MIRKVLPAATLLLALPCLAFATTPKKPTTKKAHAVTTTSTHNAHSTAAHGSVHARSSHAHYVAASAPSHHQPASMDPDRAKEIQQALIHAGYMNGEPTGIWDSQSVAAMQKLQGENGWQTKITPDSRALIKLGLGPQNDTASTATPDIAAGGGL